MSHLGRPYRWGGDNPMDGFDCSGLVIEILKSVGILPRNGDWTARGLKRLFPRTDRRAFGVLVFWGSPAHHVEFLLDAHHSLGASGGTSSTVDLDAAIAADAYIKVRPFATRGGISGFVDPFEEDR